MGYAVRNAHLLRFDELGADGRRPEPRDADFVPPVVVEPHHLVQWAARWYLIAFVPATDAWRILRLERLHVYAATGQGFTRRELPHDDVARYVMTSHDRGDTPAPWPCQGTVLMNLAPELVAEFAPGGSVVAYVSPTQTRLTLGAWSWAGIAGLLATFDADITAIEPPELLAACRTIARRYAQADAAT